jgi:hypothetical protein
MPLELLVAPSSITTMYVQFSDASNTTVAAPEGTGVKVGTYKTSDASIAASGLPIGTYGGRFRDGNLAAPADEDIDYGWFSGAIWDGVTVVEGQSVVGVTSATSNILLDEPKLIWKIPRRYDGTYASDDKFTVVQGEVDIFFGWDCRPLISGLDRISSMTQPGSSSASILPSTVSGEWGHDRLFAKTLVTIDGGAAVGDYFVTTTVSLRSGAGPYKLKGRLKVIAP